MHAVAIGRYRLNGVEAHIEDTNSMTSSCLGHRRLDLVKELRKAFRIVGRESVGFLIIGENGQVNQLSAIWFRTCFGAVQ